MMPRAVLLLRICVCLCWFNHMIDIRAGMMVWTFSMSRKTMNLIGIRGCERKRNWKICQSAYSFIDGVIIIVWFHHGISHSFISAVLMFTKPIEAPLLQIQANQSQPSDNAFQIRENTRMTDCNLVAALGVGILRVLTALSLQIMSFMWNMVWFKFRFNLNKIT